MISRLTIALKYPYRTHYCVGIIAVALALLAKNSYGLEDALVQDLLGNQRLFYSHHVRRQIDQSRLVSKKTADSSGVIIAPATVSDLRSSAGGQALHYQGLFTTRDRELIGVWINDQRWLVGAEHRKLGVPSQLIPLAQLDAEPNQKSGYRYRLLWSPFKQLVVVECSDGSEVDLKLGMPKFYVCEQADRHQQ